ncbi:hypothetical protein EVA_12597 [gut metagenome]|uniref:Uncharacterized protein n=1 Tax=gut metagenome TaxID=749906 RepID=J9FXL4_9ZZZZ
MLRRVERLSQRLLVLILMLALNILEIRYALSVIVLNVELH